MIYSNKHKFVYFSMPKTGSTTLSNILIKDYDGIAHFDRHDNRIPADIEHYFKFTTIRNPYNRAFSGYSHFIKKGKKVKFSEVFTKFHLISMTEYLTKEMRIEHHVMADDPIVKFVTNEPGPGLAVTMLRQENLEEDFAKLYFVNKSSLNKENSYPDAIDDKTRAKIIGYVAVNYVDDFKNFKYDISSYTNRKIPLFC